MPYDIFSQPIHLGLGARAESQPEFTGMPWYDDYIERTKKDGAEGRLVAMHSFTESWSSWEMHPLGHEVVLCISGSLILHQEHGDGTTESISLDAGQYAINPPGTWHTADIEAAATALFITAGVGTEHRPR